MLDSKKSDDRTQNSPPGFIAWNDWLAGNLFVSLGRLALPDDPPPALEAAPPVTEWPAGPFAARCMSCKRRTMLDRLTIRGILLFAAVLLVGGVLSAGFSYWLGNRYI